jgi:hypothetical protein
MKVPEIPTSYLLAGGAVIAALWYIKSKGAAGIGRDIAAGTIELVDSVVSETVIAGAEVVGIPRTDKTECQKRIEEFRAAPWYEQAYLSFGVSANCSAGDYLKFVSTGKGPQD